MGVTGYSVWTCDVCGTETETPIGEKGPVELRRDRDWRACLGHDIGTVEKKGWRVSINGQIVCSDECRDRAELFAAEERLDSAQRTIAMLKRRLGEEG